MKETPYNKEMVAKMRARSKEAAENLNPQSTNSRFNGIVKELIKAKLIEKNHKHIADVLDQREISDVVSEMKFKPVNIDRYNVTTKKIEPAMSDEEIET